jgi:hypothetical protein
MELDWRPLVVECDLDEAHLWTRQIQGAGGEVLGVEKLDDDDYVVRALVLTQSGMNR